MSLSVYEYLAGFQVGPDFWESGLDTSFKEFLKAINSTQGSVVLYSEQEDGFLEFSSLGYEDSDFYYEFLVRGKGNFEKLQASQKPMVFHRASGFELFNPENTLAIASRVFGSRMHGFVIVELKSESSLSLVSWSLGLFAFRIASIIEKRTEKEIQGIATLKSISTREELGELMLSYSTNWMEKVKLGFSRKFFSILSEPGSGRSHVIKYLHKSLEVPGDLIFLNLVPDQLSKLEKSISEWLKIASSGIIVIENTHLLTPAQQKLFFDFLKKNGHSTCFLFLETPGISPSDTYSPFWKLLKEIQIAIPSISSLEKEKRLSILSGLVKEVGSIHNIKGLSVSMESMEFLLEKSQELSLEEIRNVLESSVLRCKGTAIQKSDLIKYFSDKENSIVVHDFEDLDLRKSVEALERQKILLALKLFSGNQMRMAKALGISRGSLQYKMKQMELL